MKYATDDLIALLRTARVQSGLTQRELGERIGSPQSYVARLEAGRTDPKLSSLVEVARALDLDLKLVPRGAVPVVDGALRAHDFESLPGDATSRAIVAIRKFIERLQSQPIRDQKARGDLLNILADLERLRYDAPDYAALKKALHSLDRMIDEAGEDAATKPYWQHHLRETRMRLRELRNRMAHARSAAPRPAFALGDDDG